MVSLSFVYRTLVNKGLHNHTKEITMKTEKANNEKKKSQQWLKLSRK